MNYNDEKMERKFSIYDLFWNILEKWRLLLVYMVILAVVFVVYGVISNKSIEKQNQKIMEEKEQKQAEEQEEGQEEQLSISEGEQVEIYWELYQQYAKQKDYNDNAVLMKLDGENLHRTTVKFYVDKKVMNEQKGRMETDENFVKTVKGVLRNVLESSELAIEVENIIGTDDMKYFGECVDPNMTFNKVAEESVNTYSFAVVAPNKEQSEAIAQKAIEIMERESEVFKGQFGEYEIFLMSSDYMQCEEQAMITYQRDKYNTLLNSMNTLNGISSGFTEMQVEYLYELSDKILKLESKTVEKETESEGENGSEEIVLKNTTSPVLYGIAGLFVGIIIVGFLSTISYLNDKKLRLYSLEDENTGMRVIQTMIDENYISSNFIDKYLFRIRYRNLHLFTFDEALAFAIADIKTTMKKKKLNKLYLSVYDMKKQKKLAEQIVKSMEDDGLRVDFGNSILYDAQAMEKLGENDAIVFFEECNKTLFAEIEKEKMLCEEKEIHMLGMIVAVSGNK